MLECVAPTCQVEQRDAIAVPDYQCFQLYRKHACEAEDYVYGGPHIAVLPEDQFIRDYGIDQLKRTCLTLAETGKPFLLFMKFIVHKDESLSPFHQVHRPRG